MAAAAFAVASELARLSAPLPSAPEAYAAAAASPVLTARPSLVRKILCSSPKMMLSLAWATFIQGKSIQLGVERWSCALREGERCANKRGRACCSRRERWCHVWHGKTKGAFKPYSILGMHGPASRRSSALPV
mmetsp:Transcript_85502/g.170707  ORF Transcript_85502/g.170707 Transcript_85502/m.170707 type:complete len:133 (-) Transcript_85502:1473-1871(-)